MKKNQDMIQLVKSAPIIHNHDAIVIGSNLCAVLYAFNNKLPIFFSHPRRPFRFDYLDPSVDIACMGLPNESRTIVSHRGNIKVGAAKELLWEKLLFILSLAGLAPLSTFCNSLRYNGNTLVCSNEYSKIAEIKFHQAYYFGDDNCAGIISQKKVANPLYTCYDWIAFNRGGKHEIDLIETGDDFVSKIWFYPSDRIDGATAVKDACLVSHLTEEELLHFDYSQTMARFKMVAEMKKRGMRGLFNGYSPTGLPKYYKFRTTIIGRERHAQPTRPQPSVDTVEMPQVKEQDLLKDLSAACVGYNRLLDNL